MMEGKGLRANLRPPDDNSQHRDQMPQDEHQVPAIIDKLLKS